MRRSVIRRRVIPRGGQSRTRLAPRASRAVFNPGHTFIPYGDDETLSVQDAEEDEGEGGGGIADYAAYIPLVGTLFREITSGGRTAREDVEHIEAQIKNYQKMKKKAIDTGTIPIPGSKQFYANKIRTLKADLEGKKVLAGEEQTSAALYTAGYVGTVLLVFGGVAFAGAMTWKEIQKGRKTQAEIDQLRGA